MSERRIDLFLIKLLLNVGLICANLVFGLQTPTNESNNSFGQFNSNGIHPVSYNLNLIPNFIIKQNVGTINGKASILFNVVKPTQVIRLHANKLVISESKVKLTNMDNNMHYTLSRLNYNVEEQSLYLYFTENLKNGHHRLNMTFIANPFDEAGDAILVQNKYTNSSGNKQWFATTLVKPSVAHRLFPCWNVPDMKSTFNINVLHHKKYTVLSNAPQMMQKIRSNHLRLTHFKPIHNITPYQLMITFIDKSFYLNISFNKLATYEKKQNGEKIRYSRYTFENAKKALNSNLSNYIIMYTSINQVIVEDLSVQSVESKNLLVYREKDVIYDEQLDHLESKLSKSFVMGRGLAYQSVHTFISLSSWNDLWLIRALGSFLIRDTLDKMHPNWQVMQFYVVRNLQLALQKDVNSQVRPMLHEVHSFNEIDKYVSPINYEKDEAIIRMLQHILTDKVFQVALQKYIHQKTVKTREFLPFMTEIARKENHTFIDLSIVMDSWIKNSNYPNITVMRNYNSGELRIKQHPHDVAKWFVPVTFTDQSCLNFSETSNTHWLRPEDEYISFYVDKNDWVIVNLQQVGEYYAKDIFTVVGSPIYPLLCTVSFN